MAEFKSKNSNSVIEAWQWNFNENQEEPPIWINDALCRWPAKNSMAFWPDGNYNPEDVEWGSTPHCVIKTNFPNKELIVAQTDYIMRRADGSIWRAAATPFEAFYEPFDGDPETPEVEIE